MTEGRATERGATERGATERRTNARGTNDREPNDREPSDRARSGGDGRLAFGRDAGDVIQYAYVVEDAEAAIRRYVDDLGVGPWFRRGPFTPPHARYRGEHTGLTITLARAFAGNSMIEVIQQHDDGPSVYRDVIARGYGFHHWAVASVDVTADIRRFAERGYPAVFEDVTPTGARIVYIDSTAELPGMIELMEMNPAQRALYSSFYEASLDWDGSDPVREG